ncbi:gas vesicle protein GvpG [Actinacidiphila glaucinigra]|uniref:gas vesicle protein GvpG n=1 Tax=Actinacidiphila glaucinigra TaxID=235986 RepID=UPI0033A8B28C
MGLLTGLLTLPVAPLRGVTWVLDQVVAEAQRQHRDPSVVERELAELEKQLLAGRISEEEFDRREDELLDRLEALRDATEPSGFGQVRPPTG